MYPGLPYMERVATAPDVVPLSAPVALADGRVVSEVRIEPGQVRFLVLLLSSVRLLKVAFVYLHILFSTTTTTPHAQVVNIPIIAIHRADGVWGDADVFRPERWLSNDSMPPSEKLVSGYAHTLAFSDGPRNCVGLRLGALPYQSFLALFLLT